MGTVDKLVQSIAGKAKDLANKVTVVGVGQVGMATIFSLLTQNITNNVCMVDVMAEKIKGELLDLLHGSVFLRQPKISAGTDYCVSAGSSICVVTAGVRQKAKETRLDIVQRNTEVLKVIIPQLVKYSPNAILMIASNPCDVLTYVTWKISKLPMTRVIGSGCNLDSARFRYYLSERLGVASSSVNGLIIGEHGETCVPVWSGVNVAGVRLCDLNPQIGTDCDPEKWKEINVKVIKSGYEVRTAKGYTSWAIALSIAELCGAILANANSVHAVTTCVKGEYGIQEEVFLSVPCALGRCGVTDIIRQPLTDTELTELHKSADVIWKVTKGVKI